MVKNRNLRVVNEDFEPFVNEVSASAVVALLAFCSFRQFVFKIMDVGTTLNKSGILH